ncbi:MAG TPA: hypothetical protein VMM60_14010 [Ilumatobacter sp.]|nr:hypothetical protein [Ilumatobacter sp.]
MASFLDKIKGMFLGKKGAAGTGGAAGKGAKPMDVIKEKAGAVKDHVDELVDKAGEKMPPKVKDTFEKVSDKVESVIPGKKGSTADEAAVVDAEDTAPAENPYASDEVVEAAEAAEETPPS